MKFTIVRLLVLMALSVIATDFISAQAFRDMVASPGRPDWEVAYDDCTGEVLVRVLVFREEGLNIYDDFMEDLTILYEDNDGNDIPFFKWELGTSSTDLPSRGTFEFTNCTYGCNSQVFALSYLNGVTGFGGPNETALLYPDIITDPSRKYWHYLNVKFADLPDDLFGKLTKISIKGNWNSRSIGGACGAVNTDYCQDNDFRTTPYRRNAENSVNTSTDTQLKIGAPLSLSAVGSGCSTVRLEWTNPNNIANQCGSSSEWGVRAIRNDNVVLDGFKNGFVLDLNPIQSATYRLESYWKPNPLRENTSDLLGSPLEVNKPTLINGPSNINATDDRTDERCDKKIQISWSPSPSAEGYRLLRNGVEIKEIDETTLSTTDDNPLLNQEVNYTVQAKNICGDWGPPSPIAMGYADDDPIGPTTVNAAQNDVGNGIIVSWNDPNSAEIGYIVERTFPGGGSAFVKELPANARTWTDTDVNQCVSYTYTVKAVMSCAQGGIGDSSATAILAPNLSNTFTNDGKGFLASKGKYTDKIELSWMNNKEGQTNTIKIFRRILESGDSFVLLNTLSSNSGVYNDLGAEAGELYEYEIVAEGPCENAVIPSNRVRAIGFRRKTGIITGKVTYTGGVNVANVKITAGDASNNTYPSLDMATADSATIFDDSSLDLSDEMIIETWFKPDETINDFDLIKKSGSYQISYSSASNQYIFSVITDVGSFEVQVKDTFFQLDKWNHIGGMLSDDSLSLYVNGVVESRIGVMPGADIIDNASDLIIGSGFKGHIKEMRQWNIGKSDLRMGQDYSRFLAGNEVGLKVYLNVSERKGLYMYDFSRIGSDLNNNHALLSSAGMWDDSDSPVSERLSIAAFTNMDGEYTLVLPFSGAGQNFVLKPVFGIHKFEPSSRPVFIGDGASVQNNIDFEDVSSFDTSGEALFYGTNCPSAGLLVKIDGEAVVKDGEPVFTDEDGMFDIQVPIGRHVITLEKNGHQFSQGRFPPLPMEDWNFQADVPGIEFIDSTFRKVIGRVVGGERERDKAPGMGRSRNNIGQAELIFEPLKTCGWIDSPTSNPRLDTSLVTIDTSGEYAIVLPPLEYKVPRPVILSNSGLNVIDDENVTLDLRNIPFSMSVVDTLVMTDSSLVIDSVRFHKKFDFIYRSPIEVTITDPDGSPLKGDDQYSFVHSKLGTFDIDLVANPLDYPVFTQNRAYSTLLSTFEEYVNKDGAGEVVDRVPVTSGVVIIKNDLATQSSLSLNLSNIENYDGDTTYNFIAGQPNITGDFSKLFQVSLASGTRNDTWLLPNGNVFKGYVVGVRDVEESDFTTQGPELVEYILRDPPGSQSFAERTVGTSSTTEKSWEWNVGGGVDIDKTVYGGTKFNLGIGYSTTTEIEATVAVGLKTETTGGEGQTVIETITNEEVWSTSSSPLLAGAGSDLFIGTSRNYLFGVSTKLVIVPVVACSNSLIECIGPEKNGFRIATQKSLSIAGDDFETEFIYTASHIETYEIPQLEELRNQFIENSPYYDVLLEPGDPCYAANNDDPRWINGDCFSVIPPSPDALITTEEDNDGPSYTFTDPLANMPDTVTVDSVRVWNQQIRLWKEALAFNEEQKALAQDDPTNYSYAGGGSSFTRSSSNTSNFTQSSTFEFALNQSLAFKVGGKVAGAGFDESYSVALTQNRKEGEKTVTDTTEKVSFTISDDSEWDDFTFDVYEGSSTGGPIFKILGGRTSCPHEGKVVSKYYEPGTVLSPGSIQLEQPTLTITPPVLYNIPQGEAGVFTAIIGNENQVGESWGYRLGLLNESNEGGALIINSGTSELSSTFVLQAGQQLEQKIIVESGASYVHDSLLFVLASTCQYQQGSSAERDIADSAYFSISFIPECSPIELRNPTDQWVVNNSYNDTLDVILGGYDYNYLNLDLIKFQYKPSSEGESGWITEQTFYHPTNDTLRFQNHPEYNYISNNTIFSLHEWDLSSLPDGEYDFRALTDCKVATSYSDVFRGYIDTQDPHAFGTPSPADGILDPDEDITIRFNEDIDPAYVSNFNFDIRAKLNGTTIRQQENLAFDGTSDYGLIPEYQLQNRDLTIEFWARRGRSGQQEVVFSQGVSTQDQCVVGFNSSDKLFLQLGSETIESESGITDTDWHFYAVTFDKKMKQVEFYIDNTRDGQPLSFSGVLNSTGPILIAKNSAINRDYFQGALQEIRLWGIVRDQGSIAELSGVTLSGREPGLMGNWRLDDSWGRVGSEKVRSRHIAVFGAVWNQDQEGDASHTYQLNGIDEYLKVDTAGTLSIGISDDVTIEGWVKTKNTGQKQTVLSNGVPSVTQPSWWSISVNTSGALMFENNGNVLTTGVSIADDSWHHFSFVLERNFAISVYIDGQLVETDNATLFKDFGGASLVLGAQIDGIGASASYSQFYGGFLDDVRIWNVARKPEQVGRDFISQLSGDEVGLLAYYPFDFYAEVAGVPSLTQTLDNQVVNTDKFNLTAMGGTYSTISPTIKLPRRVKKIIPTFSVNNDEIFIDLNIAPRDIENVIVDISVRSIRDYAGNYMTSPETWTAFIDKNQVFWEQEYFNFEKKLEDNLSFRATIKNTGGSQESYNLSNLPSWLTATPSSGLIEPNSQIEVNFEVEPLLNIGEYEQDIFVTTESFGFNERLLLDLKVVVDPPDWTVVEDDFDQSMNIVGQFEINGVISTDDEDMVSVWINDELRGVTHVEFDPSSGKYLVFLTVLSNVSSGEILEFRAWDASRGRLLKGLTPDNIAFIGGGVINSRTNPLPIEATVLTQLTYVLNAGWNWISFPLDHPSLDNINTVLTELSPSESDQIKSQDRGADQNFLYSGGAWRSSTPGVTTNLGYKVMLAKQDTFRYEGTFMDPATEPIEVVEGWNWIGVKSEFIIDVPSAMASLDPQTGDVIKGQRSFAIYEDGFGWGGNLDFLQPQKGYMLQYHKTDQLIYPGNLNARSKPESQLKSRSHKGKEYARLEKSLGYAAGSYSSTMSLTAEVDDCIVLATQGTLDLSQWSLTAHAGDECRGVVESAWIERLGKYLYYLSIEGNATVPLTFKLVHNTNGKEIVLNQSMDFNTNEVMGTNLLPYQFSCVSQSDCIESNLYQSADVDMSQSEITQQVISDLRSNALLPSGRVFRFKAGTSIELMTTFEVSEGATLEAYIEDCITARN